MKTHLSFILRKIYKNSVHFSQFQDTSNVPNIFNTVYKSAVCIVRNSDRHSEPYTRENQFL